MSNANAPAMPQSVSRSSDGAVISSSDFVDGWGLSKREYFAAKAMQGLLSNPGVIDQLSDSAASFISIHSRILADALLVELEKGQSK